jgi:hypothetical protein
MVPAYTAGADVTFRVARRFSAVALARWHQLVDDGRTPDGVVKRGVSSTISGSASAGNSDSSVETDMRSQFT